MKKQYKTMDQLKDSRLLYEQKIPAFGYYLILIVIVACIATVLWSMKAHKPYIIKSQGTVTNENSAYVMSVYAGEIEEFYMEEGKLVQSGDILFSVKSTDYDLQQEQLLADKESYEKKIKQYQLLVKSIQDDKNYFDPASSEDRLYYSTYEVYKSQVEQNSFDGSVYSVYGYSEDQIQNEVDKNAGKVSEIYYSAISNADNAIKEAETQIENIDAQLQAIGNGQEEYVVRAENIGVVHMLADYKKGMVVQTGTAVATITPQNSETIIEAYISTADMARIEVGNYVQIAVEGLMQSAYGTISGTVIQIDSNATTLEERNSNSSTAFKIRIKPNENYLISKTGKKVDISNGMTTEIRIIYDEETYFDYVLEKLGLLVR